MTITAHMSFKSRKNKVKFMSLQQVYIFFVHSNKCVPVLRGYLLRVPVHSIRTCIRFHRAEYFFKTSVRKSLRTLNKLNTYIYCIQVCDITFRLYYMYLHTRTCTTTCTATKTLHCCTLYFNLLFLIV